MQESQNLCQNMLRLQQKQKPHVKHIYCNSIHCLIAIMYKCAD